MTTVPVAIEQLEYEDTFHLAPHQIWRHSESPHTVTCPEADVQVDCVLDVKHVIVIICWRIPAGDGRTCPAVCGATAYDADDCVLREVAAA